MRDSRGQTATGPVDLATVYLAAVDVQDADVRLAARSVELDVEPFQQRHLEQRPALVTLVSAFVHAH
jgi:hypothetical protein